MSRREMAAAQRGRGREGGGTERGSLPPAGSTIATLVFILLSSAPMAAPEAGAATPADAHEPAPWLDVPAGWSRTLQGEVVAVVPDDLPPGGSFLLLVEPPRASTASLAADYEAALTDLGPWTPVGAPIESPMESGWVFRLGVGVTRLDGATYTAQVAVGRHGDTRARFWALADSDDTFNRYKSALANAIVSVQDLGAAPPAGAEPSALAAVPPAAGSRLDPGFGQGLSGVYVGLERGLSAGAGGGGQEMTLDPVTGQLGSRTSAGAPATQVSISDFLEVDVFFPDGTYRRRLPIRGLGADLDWERRQQPVLWGRWTRQGDQVVVQRGSYTTTYTVRGEELVSDRDRPWRKVPPPRNVRLEGSFARDDYRDATAPRLVLHADGSYEDRGGFLRMVGSAWNLVVPDGDAMLGHWTQAQIDRAMAAGSGTYTFDAFTLALSDRDGRVWQINAYLPPGESLSRPQRLVINGRALVRD
ncbi:MAG: hypothetical protein OES32_11690 [Acidobacteriota bacterium]|nr:hypothetical protein [Acidobacteriota bacterium]